MFILLLALACTPDPGDTSSADVTPDPAVGDSAGDSGDTGDTGDSPETGGEDSSADTGGDTAADTSVDSGDSGGGEPTPPVVTFTTFAEVDDNTLSIDFTVEDVDGDAEAGGLDVVVEGVTAHLAYADLDSWDGRAGSTSWPIEPCQHGETWTVLITATDGAGLAGTADTTTTLSGTSFEVSEDGDEVSDAVDLGDLAAPVWVCGDADRAVDSLYVAGQDFDWFTIEPGVSDHYTVSLTWTEPYADEDLYLTDGATAGVDERAQDHTAAQPEEIAHALDAGTLYYVYVVGWSLPATDYVLRIE